MSTLIENLHNNNVIFSYYGFIDDKVLGEVLQITKSKLEGNNENPQVVTRVHDAINECVDNVIKHNFYPDDDHVRYKSLLVVSKQEDDYLIDTINVVNSLQKDSINEQLNFLNTRSKEELHALKSKSLMTAQHTPVVGKGLIDLVLKADNCDCTFKDLEANFLFNINFKINSLN
ncbi:hypothetical protein CNR22_08595 [Sphingobacteriaceae bacterium]|nr:hypothetical protein CNR22_08595 [Sphingobacteriaceae bacterium]